MEVVPASFLGSFKFICKKNVIVIVSPSDIAQIPKVFSMAHDGPKVVKVIIIIQTFLTNN